VNTRPFAPLSPLALILLALLFLAGLRVSQAQSRPVSVKDSVLLSGLVHVEYGLWLPFADLSDRYGLHHSIGLTIEVKNRHNWIFGAGARFHFGNRITEEGILDALLANNGALIGIDGILYPPNQFMRGFAVDGRFGKLFGWPAPNPNSGIYAMLGMGFIQYKIGFDVDPVLVPQLGDEAKKGYDRLSNGFLLEQEIGYQYLGHKRFINLRVSVVLSEGFTESRRAVFADRGIVPEGRRLDLGLGFKFAWTLPIYEKPKTRYFYY
jgi:hypothetical protein